jgi:hypothetical protein
MDWIRDKLSAIGIFLALAGIVSSVLQLVGYELRIFRALDAQGPATAWAVRIGCIVVGGLLFVVADRGQKAHATDEWTGYREAALADGRMRAFLDQVKAQLGAALVATEGSPRVAHFTFVTDGGEVVPAGDARAVYLIAYVDRPEGKLQVAQDLRTGQISQTPLDAMQWSAVVH